MDTQPTPATAAASGSTEDGPQSLKRSNPTKVLPTDRLTMERQMAAAAAFAAVFESKGSKPVTNEEAGAVVQPTKMAAATIAMTNAFFCTIGMLTRQDNGSFTVAQEVMAFFNAQHGLSPETAPEKLRPLFEKQWFMLALGPRLKLGAQDVQTVYKVLAEACNAGKDQLKRLETLVEMICHVGLARKDGNQLRSVTTLVTQDLPPKQNDGARNGGDTMPNEEGLEKYTLTLNPSEKRRIVIYSPPTVTSSELKRIQSWLSYQLIVSDSPDSVL